MRNSSNVSIFLLVLWQPLGSGRREGQKLGADLGFLQFNKCQCGALCQLHKQAAISVLCILWPFMVLAWAEGWTFFISLFRQEMSTGYVLSAPFWFAFTLQMLQSALLFATKKMHGWECWIAIFYFLHPYFLTHMEVKLGTLLTSIQYSHGFLSGI